MLLIWAVVYLTLRSNDSTREMLIVSLWTSLLGLTEPLFVPAYLNPPSIFDLVQRTRFDIESLLFSFAVGGLAVVVYETIFSVRHETVSLAERHQRLHRFHALVLLSAPVILVLSLAASLNPIYAAILSLAVGGVLTWLCRPDLLRKILVSAFLFPALYFFYFLTLVAACPDYVPAVWNLKAISGIRVLGVPMEELLFAFSLGFFMVKRLRAREMAETWLARRAT